MMDSSFSTLLNGRNHEVGMLLVKAPLTLAVILKGFVLRFL